MTGSIVGPGKVSDGHGLVLWVPAIANPLAPTLAELTAPGVLDLTYRLFPDGFDHQSEVTKFETGRYTLAQTLENEGKQKDTIVLKYPIEGTEDDVVRLALTQFKRGWVVERLGTANEVPLADGQYLSVVAPVQCGKQKKIPVTANTELGKQQELLPTGKVETDVLIGGGGALAWDVTVTGTPTGGTYTLSVNGVPTAPIAYGANAAAVQSAINGISGVTGITATATGSAPIAVTLSAKATLAGDGSGLTGGTAPGVTVVVTP